MSRVRLAHRAVGDDAPCFIVAELGQNHNGDLATALALIRAAKAAGADAVKFQKRTVEVCVPEAMREVRRELPDGRVVSYLEYRRFLEFGRAEYDGIAHECKILGIPWWASAWDRPSLDFLLGYGVPALKVPSACLTDDALLQAMARTARPVILSTGMSTAEEIGHAVETILDETASPLVLLHCKSAYPTAPAALNLRAITTLQHLYGEEAVIGWSGHEVGLWTSLMAVVLGAAVVERHFTLNRAAWGSDQSASLEPQGLAKLVQQIRRWEEARGDGRLGVDPSEAEPRRRLRRPPAC